MIKISSIQYIGETKKGERIAIEIPEEEEKVLPIETGHIDESRSFQICYVRVQNYVEKFNKQIQTAELVPKGHSLQPFIVFNIEGERGYEPLATNNTFCFNDVIYQVNRELDVADGMSLKIAKRFVNRDPIKPKTLDKLYRHIRNFLKKYTWYENDRIYDLETLYVIGSYFHQAFDVYPIFALRGPVGCGKTRTNYSMCTLAYNALFSPNLSDAAFYYARSSFHCTLGLDERRIRDKQAKSMLEDLINNSYRKGGYVMRISDEKPRQLRFFPVYGPLIYSSTKEMPYATSTRALEVWMQITNKPEYSDMSEASRDQQQTVTLRNALYYAALKHGSDICRTYKGLSNKDYNIANRDWELFKPFITLFKIFSPHTEEDLLIEIIKEHIKSKTVDRSEELDYQILMLLKNIIDDETMLQLHDGYLYLSEFSGYAIESLELNKKFNSWRTVRKSLKNLGLYLDPSKGSGNRTKFKVDDWIERSGLKKQEEGE